MKFTYHWLKDFVEVKIPAERLAEKLTNAGLEVTSLKKIEDDFVFEVEVTSNRPDCLSVAGISREVSAILGARLKFKDLLPPKRKNYKNNYLKIHIQNKRDCPVYVGILIKDLEVASSPDWLKKRLELVGLRSINNIVDITNYVLLSWGQPLHAFDWDKFLKIAKTPDIFVRRANKEEKIITLDGIERTLNEEILLITAGKEEFSYPVAIAGIMGGKETEVDFNTKSILLESAIFEPVLIRRGKRRLGLETLSSYRFERGLDLFTHWQATYQAIALLEKLCKGKIWVYQEKNFLKSSKAKNITLDINQLNSLLGINITQTKAKNILNSLGLKTKPITLEKLKVKVPLFRQDIKEKEDLIEEIARIFGYENIPLSIPKILPQPAFSPPYDLVNLIKEILVGLGLEEVITYSLLSKDNPLLQKEKLVEILNPLSSQQDALRNSLIPGLLEVTAYNFCQGQDYVGIFEIAKVYFLEEDMPQERLNLGIILAGTKSFLSAQGLIKEKLEFLHLKGILENLSQRLNLNFDLKPEAEKLIVTLQGKNIGQITKIPQKILEPLDIKYDEVWALEIDLEETLKHINLERSFAPLPIYPGIRRDISLLIKEDLAVKDILEFIKAKAAEFLSKLEIIDYYRGKQIPAGFKALTFSLLYQSKERTLTEEEIQPLHLNILEELKKNFDLVIRA